MIMVGILSRPNALVEKRIGLMSDRLWAADYVLRLDASGATFTAPTPTGPRQYIVDETPRGMR